MSLFRKVLIANRGEIAVRIARTCRVMGIPTVAVYSEADRGALHIRETDEAVLIGPAEAQHSYLDGDALVAAAERTGATAVHPGYGFLSQNGDFADRVAAAGLVFIGPPGAVHRRMGDKKGARRLMAAAGVPVVPGYDGDDQQDATLLAEARRIGWPVILKPSRGGGGKGMRVVGQEADFASALASSRREARSAFGDDVMVLERFLARPRHVEVQVLADASGGIVHLGERECSIQRRHQKVVEETPSPALTPALRESLLAAGVAAARAAGYVNAGTVEFLLDAGGDFHFLEMNTRLQVEHPVTEAVTGLDLVRLQLEIAAGRPLPFDQAGVVSRGHALECRLYAEDARRGDIPSPGRILLLNPPAGPGVRFDSGVATGSEVGVHYDPLLAKVVTWGADREEAIDRMIDALAQTTVLGVVTNQERLREIVLHPAFRRGDLHTGFIDEHLGEIPPAAAPPEEALAALAAVMDAARPASGARITAADPWSSLGSWRLGGTVDGRSIHVEETGPGRFVVHDGARSLAFYCVKDGATTHLAWRGAVYALTREREVSRTEKRQTAGALEAPMPGKVIAVRVAAGQAVRKGDELLVIEAMKMENALRAPRDGTVRTVAVQVGDMVSPGTMLVELDA